MKVLLVSPLPPTVGGISIFAGNLIDHLKSNSNGMNLILCNAVDKHRSVVSESTLFRIISGIKNSIRIYFEVRKIILNERPQLIHIASSASLALLRDNMILNIANRYNIPVVTHWHFGRIPALANKRNWEWKLLTRVIHKSARTIVIDGKSHKALLVAGFSNVQYVPNPIGRDFEEKAIMLNENTHQRAKDRIVFVGHIIKSKGVYELVQACAELDIVKELWLVGPYEKITEKELLLLAKKRDNGAWLKLTGTLSRSNVMELMQNSSVIILPSYTEGFPNVVLEAMSMGCAVIATDVGAIPEMLAVDTTSPCGICVSVQNSKELKKAISDLMENSSLTRTLGCNGIKRILNNYTLDRVVRNYRQIWEGLVTE